MSVLSDSDLLREYVRNRSEEAFETLVKRHVPLVYSAALRQAGDRSMAEEVTQVVFIILARKAGTLREETIVSGWLYRTARFAAADALKKQSRRQKREQEAVQMQTTVENEAAWEEMAPLVDDAMAKLGSTDRNAVLLRYFENKTLAEVGAALDLSEDTARKRVARALEKLRSFFVKRGKAIPAVTIATLLSAKAVEAAPASLGHSVAALALLKGGPIAGSAALLLNGTLKLMAWAKIKVGLSIGLATLVVAGTGVAYVALSSEDGISSKAPPEPWYQGKSLREWIVAEPREFPVIAYEDSTRYRRNALEAMGKPAIRYLHWMVANPEAAFSGEPRPIDIPQPGLGASKPVPGWYPRASFMHAVMGLQLIGPRARAAAPDLVRLWESGAREGHGIPMGNYNGFPITLGVLGDKSPGIIAALHRHFDSPNEQHRAYCAMAAWRLNPGDAEAIKLLHLALNSTNHFIRVVVVAGLSEYGSDAPLTPFMPEIRAVIAKDLFGEFGNLVAKPAWDILKDAEPAKQLVERLAATARKADATDQDVNRFASVALDLCGIPGMNSITKPMLKELSSFHESSAAKFSSNILVMISEREKRR